MIRRKEYLIDLLLISVVAIWGLNYAVMKVMYRYFHPIAFNAFRFTVLGVAKCRRNTIFAEIWGDPPDGFDYDSRHGVDAANVASMDHNTELSGDSLPCLARVSIFCTVIHHVFVLRVGIRAQKMRGIVLLSPS